MSPRIGFVQISHSAKKIALMNLSLVVESIRLIEVRARTCLCKLLNTHIDDVIKTEKIFQETETATRPSARLKTTNKTKRKCHDDSVRKNPGGYNKGARSPDADVRRRTRSKAQSCV